jgi:hypothetical protein
LSALEQEQGDEFLPGGGGFGEQEDTVAKEDKSAGSEKGFEVGVPVADQVFMQELEQMGHEAGPAELEVEFLATTQGVGFGQGRPFGGGGKLPEDAIQQEAVGVGDGAGPASEQGGLLLVEVFKEGLEHVPMTVVEEGSRGGGQSAVGVEGGATRPPPNLPQILRI